MTLLALHHESASRPGFGSLVAPDEPGAEPVAHVWPGNPIGADGQGEPLPPLTGDLVCYSGWCGQADAAGVVRPDLRTWSATGWTAFERTAKAIDEAAEAAGVVVILRPHARHVLADPQCTLAWLKRTEPQRIKILLDPAAWLTPSMMDAAEDHLARAFESFTGHPAVWGTMLTGLTPEPIDCADSSDNAMSSSDSPFGPELVSCPLSDARSVLPVQTLLGVVGRYPLSAHPVVLGASVFEAQRALLAPFLAAAGGAGGAGV